MFCKLIRIHGHKLELAKMLLNFVSPGCMKMGRFLMTWDDEASSAN
jgi:hypothetical protein